jgi:hypothetical protein
MYHEGEKIKKVVKVKNTFLQISGQKDWKTCREMFPDETEGSVLAAWTEKLAPEVSSAFTSLTFGMQGAIPVSLPAFLAYLWNARSDTGIAAGIPCLPFECKERYRYRSWHFFFSQFMILGVANTLCFAVSKSVQEEAQGHGWGRV